RYLHRTGALDEDTLDHLAEYRFTGDVHGYEEGELYFPGSPVLRVEGTFGDSVLLETVILSILNHDSGVASAGSRMVTAARGRPCIEMGGRRDRRRPRRLRGRIRLLLEPGRRSPLPGARGRHRGPRLHVAVRQRGGGVPRSAGLPGCWDHAPRRHLRRRARGAHRRGAGRP